MGNPLCGWGRTPGCGIHSMPGGSLLAAGFTPRLGAGVSPLLGSHHPLPRRQRCHQSVCQRRLHPGGAGGQRVGAVALGAALHPQLVELLQRQLRPRGWVSRWVGVAGWAHTRDTQVDGGRSRAQCQVLPTGCHHAEGLPAVPSVLNPAGTSWSCSHTRSSRSASLQGKV